MPSLWRWDCGTCARSCRASPAHRAPLSARDARLRLWLQRSPCSACPSRDRPAVLPVLHPWAWLLSTTRLLGPCLAQLRELASHGRLADVQCFRKSLIGQTIALVRLLQKPLFFFGTVGARAHRLSRKCGRRKCRLFRSTWNLDSCLPSSALPTSVGASERERDEISPSTFCRWEFSPARDLPPRCRGGRRR